MKVLILNHSDKFGGAANSTIRIFKSLQKKKGLKIYLYVKKKNLSDSKIIEQSRFIYLLTKLSDDLKKVETQLSLDETYNNQDLMNKCLEHQHKTQNNIEALEMEWLELQE